MFLAQITALVAATFTNALGYSAAFRAAMVTFLNTQIVTLVSSTNPAEELDAAIREVLDASIYANTVGPTKELIDEACENTINFAKAAFTNPAGLGIGLFAKVSQAGVAAPVFDSAPYPNTMGEVPTWGRNGVGDYDLNFATTLPFVDPQKVSVDFRNLTAGTNVSYLIAAPNQLQVFVEQRDVAAAPGNVGGTLTDGLISSIEMQITVFP